MILTPGTISSRLAALGLTTLVLAGLGIFVFLPAFETLRASDRALRHEIALKGRLIASHATLGSEKAALGAHSGEPLGWRGQRTGEVAARIQSDLSRMAREKGIVLRSVTPFDAEPVAQTRTIGLRVEVEAALDSALGLLRAIETADRPILVGRANLRRLNRQSASSVQPLIFMRLELVAPVILSRGNK